jgi:hypothetical protein
MCCRGVVMDSPEAQARLVRRNNRGLARLCPWGASIVIWKAAAIGALRRLNTQSSPASPARTVSSRDFPVFLGIFDDRDERRSLSDDECCRRSKVEQRLHI